MQVKETCHSKIAGHWRASREEAYRRLGDLWEGVALCHSHSPVHKLEYMRLVYEQAMRLKREATREVASADAGGGRKNGPVFARRRRDRQRRLHGHQSHPDRRGLVHSRLGELACLACAN